MSLGVLLVDKVAVVGTYQLDAVFACELHQHLVGLLLQGESFAVGADARVLHFVPLQLEVIVVAENALVPLQGLLGTLKVALEYLGRHLAGYARRADNKSLVVRLEVGAVGTRTHVEAVYPCTADKLDKVLVALVVLCQYYKVVTALVAFLLNLVGLGAACNVHLASEYGLELRLALFLQFAVLLLAVVEELLDAHHVAVVGHSHAAHAVGYGLVDKPLDACLAVKNAIICMYV